MLAPWAARLSFKMSIASPGMPVNVNEAAHEKRTKTPHFFVHGRRMNWLNNSSDN
jgi:hypothetical protein